MLELKNLTKIYKTKGGDVKALDDVSVSFGSTGLVFLLGKSGSGKSTLLNVAGGLDSPTAGEVIVMGKSSKDFSGSDFDSYRNTYVGFIFQEYNVLNEFNVEDNVALAIELQGRKATREQIDAILGEVELEAYAKRKPNTLSGGQKQRIAIARALVKNPQIIMADEPTGALDSTTGRQVFDALKRLSKSRLVLVVSHDREFAEIYGDRIIELKDGKIVSDVTKVREQAEAVTERITRHGNTLTVQGGTADKATMSAIQAFLLENEGEVLISKDSTDIALFKRAARINGEGARERFGETPPEKPYEGEEAKFIRSRLPGSKALRIGASSLKFKPFRLVFTILLSVIAFVMFGLFSTMMLYDGDSVLVNSFLSSEYEYLTMSKVYQTRVTGYRGHNENYSYTSPARFTEEELAAFGENAFGAFTLGGLSPSNAEIGRTDASFYIPCLYHAAVLDKNHPLVSDMVGTYPVLPNEIAVSEYFLECMQNATFSRVNEEGEKIETKTIHTANDLIGERIVLAGDYVFTITGVFKKSGVFEKYRALKEDDSNWILSAMYQIYLMEGLPTLALVSESFTETFSGFFIGSGSMHMQEWFDYADRPYELSYGNGQYDFYRNTQVKIWSGDSPYAIEFFGEKKTSLADDEFIVPLYYLYSYYQANLSPSLFDEFFTSYDVWINGTVIVSEGGSGDVWFQEVREATPEEIAEAREQTLSFVAAHPMKWEVSVSGEAAAPANIVGIYLRSDEYYWGDAFCSESFYARVGGYPGPTYETNYVPEENARYDSVLVPMQKSAEGFRNQLSALGKFDEHDVGYQLDNILFENVALVNAIVDTLQTVFLWVGIVLAAFASLLLFNFITVSISNKKKEIGILRAVGARGLDVFKIFFAESGIIVGICVALSVVGSILFVNGLNAVLRMQAGLDVTLFVFGPLSALIMIAVALLVALISTFLPVYFAARKKPVESIRAL